MDVIIFGGQSNMQGQSERLSEHETVGSAWEYKMLSDELVPLRNPVGEDITYEGGTGYTFYEGTDPAEWLRRHVLGAACYGHTNLVPAFCRSYLAGTQGSVLAVHAAKGSTTAAEWLPGTPGYEMLKRKTLCALRKASETEQPGYVSFVWLQGESDAIEGKTKAKYKTELIELFAALRREIGVNTFGIIRVGRFTNDDRDLEIMAAQDELCREEPGFAMLTDMAASMGTDPENMNLYVGGHFSAKGLERLGTAAGATLALFARRDDAYREFQGKLIPTVDPRSIIGVRTPELRAMAKVLAKQDRIDAFLHALPHRYFDEYQLHAFIVGELKDIDACLAETERLLPYVNNWATCDQLSPKIFAKHPDKLLPRIREWLASDAPYTVRFGIGMLMEHFLDDRFDPAYPAEVAALRSDEYYVNMMIAWYFATALAKQYDAVLPFIEHRALATWTHNKAIQKALESRRLTDGQKEYLKRIRISP
jgi:3-methyladenine DNA glycosylase AlkD